MTQSSLLRRLHRIANQTSFTAVEIDDLIRFEKNYKEADRRLKALGL